MKKLVLKLLVCAAAFVFMFSGNAAAFQDISEGDESYDEIMKLHEMGILSGIDGKFVGDKQVTYAEGIHLIVKGMNLSLAAHTFIKAPVAEDFFERVPEDAWYTDSLVVAAVNGLELPPSLDPDAVMSREEFAHHLFTALQVTGPYPFNKMLYPIQDSDEITKDYMNSIQLMLNGRMAELDEDGKFRPQDIVTRKEAAVLLFEAIQFKQHHTPISPIGADDVTYAVGSVTDEINKVTISWGEQPNPGYGISITGIKFDPQDQIATVLYQRSYPDPELMYPQVIVTPTAETYVSSAYTVEIVEHVQPAIPINPIKPIPPELPLPEETEIGEQANESA